MMAAVVAAVGRLERRLADRLAEVAVGRLEDRLVEVAVAPLEQPPGMKMGPATRN